MKRAFVFIASLLALAAALLSADTPQEAYVEKWAKVAVSEMYRSGVPASITLAQGLLESRYGLSELATKGNNHFGIKCHKDWKGKSMAYDDDEKGECFRVYGSADESFRDHSDFLRYRDRYKFLFDLETKDYKGWAYGLKKAGYATDPNYPTKLIKYIEDYRLYEYDSMTLADFKSKEPRVTDNKKSSGTMDVKWGSKSGDQDKNAGSDDKDRKKQEKEPKMTRAEKKAAKEAAKEEKKAERKAAKASAVEDEEIVDAVIPQSPLSIEEPKKIDKSSLEEFKFSLNRATYSRNGVPFVLSVEGETYSSIANSYGLFDKEILRYNDLSVAEELMPGTVVYIQAKKNQCAKGLDKYIVGEEEQSLRDICQRFGVKMSSVQKMNALPAGYQPREGDTILLRSKKMKK